MGSSFLKLGKLGGALLETAGGKVLKGWAKESDHLSKVIGSQSEPFTTAVIKEINEYPPAADELGELIKNNIPDYLKRGNELLQQPQLKQNVKQLQDTVNPEAAAKSAVAEETVQKQVRAQSTELFDDLNRQVHGEKWDNVLAEEGLEGTGRVQKGPEGEVIPNKQSVFVQQRQAELSPHHLSEKSFDLKAIQNWAPEEQVQYVKDSNSVDIFPGNHPRNWLGLFHDNTGTLIKRQQAQIQKLRREAGMEPLTRRKLDDWYKADAHGPTKTSPAYGKAELQSPDPEIQAGAKSDLARGTIKRNWSEILPPGKTIEDIKVDPVVISRDHQEFTHGVTNRLPSTKHIKELQAKGQWDNLPYKERFKLKTINAIQKQNVAFNIGLKRIKLIRQAMGKPNAKWDDIVAWMAENPERAGSIGWHEQLSRGGDLFNQLQTSEAELIADLKPKDLRLVGNVFGIKDVPNSSAKFKKWLKIND